MDILSRHYQKELDIDIPYMISNFEDAREITEKFSIPFFYIPAKIDSFEHEIKWLEISKKYPTDVICLARYMKILSKEFIE